MSVANKPDHYDGSDIQVLEGLEAVRKRPGMYIGSTGPRGLHHLVYEVVDNAVDEALAGYCDEIKVWIHQDNSISVDDNGRGIPIDKHPKEKIPTVEVVLTILHAGGKFGGEGYKVSGGLHGVGVSVVNALSSRVEVQVRKEGKEYFIGFDHGKTSEKLREVGPTKRGNGTTVSFWPDPEIFTETTVYDFDTLANRFREMAFLNKGLKIVLYDERVTDADGNPRTEVFQYAGHAVVHLVLNELRHGVCEQHQHARRRHAPRRLQAGRHAHHQRVRPLEGHPQREGFQPLRRRHA